MSAASSRRSLDLPNNNDFINLLCTFKQNGRNKLFKDYLLGFYARCTEDPLFIPPYLENTAFAQLIKEQYSIYTSARDFINLPDRTTAKSAFPPTAQQSNLKRDRLIATDLTAEQHSSKDNQLVPSNAQYEALKNYVMDNNCMSLIVKDYRLPTGWHPDIKNKGVEISLDGLGVQFRAINKDDTEIGTVQGNHAVKRQCGIFYYEIEILSKTIDNDIGIGFAKKAYNFDRFPGWETESWGFHGENGKLYAGPGFGIDYGPKWGSGDVVGCGVDYRDMSIFFTKNGRFLGKAFSNIKDIDLYPVAGMRTPERIEANFGRKPFKFDIREYVASGKAELISDILHSSLSPFSGNTSISNNKSSYELKIKTDEILMEYLKHNGYDRTARLFGRSINAEQEIDESTTQREICRSVVVRDIDKALQLLTEQYPDVLEQNQLLLLKLKCQKLIEMVRGVQASNTIQTPSDDNNSSAEMQTDNLRIAPTKITGEKRRFSNDRNRKESGHAQKKQRLTKDDAARSITLEDVITYGRSLRRDYQYLMSIDSSYNRELMSAFSTLAYTDLSHPAVAHLYSQQHIESIASEVNSAISVSLGKYPTSSLERIYRHTSLVLRNLIIAGNGKASLINLDDDCLH